MSVPRISSSSYSNTAPLIWSFLYGRERGKYELVLDNAPARSAELLLQKRVDAAFVPVIAYQMIEDLLVVPVCVGSKAKVKSVCLVTKGEDLKDAKSVSLDISSKTSVALTKIIFREFFEFEPVWKTSAPNLESMLTDSDCALLIGDPALMVDEKKYRKFDLAEVWKQHTGFGFVFAMWMANRDRSEIARQIDFEAAKDDGLQHLDEIIANYQMEIPLSVEDFRSYLTENIAFEVDESMLKGLNLYFLFAYKHALIPQNRELEFI
jgi:chorismate dehydratase